MDELDQSGSCIDDMSTEQLESSDTCDSFGDPEIAPRIGDQYQVEIPPLLGEYDCALYKRNPMGEEEKAGLPFNFLKGLPIPVIWKKQEVGPIKHETKSFSNSETSSDRNGALGLHSSKRIFFCFDKIYSDIKVEPADIPADDRAAFATPGNKEKQMQCICPGYHLVPGSDVDPWSDNEKGTFLLGLYIFEKNFVQVKRFVESKSMGGILSFYYGKFYGSHEYRRWSECRKAKGRKCVHGDKLFTGLRQQELLSRLLLSVSNECQNALLEVTKTFAEGRMSLEEYVFTLKAMVGTNTLVEAVGIGRGKQDLTCMAVDFPRSSQGISVRSEIPTGKACADLEPSEIIKFLTGNFRLSKARASDLFWEAVWPRLLARGWQSMQPKSAGKDSLVFLVPGIKKFSRRRLVKGRQYFDSVTDILSKVASEPALLELDSGNEKGNNYNEDVWTPETKQQPDNMPTPKRHCYLQPRTTSKNSSGLKFTVVDTSLADGRPYKVKELRSLPLEVSSKTMASDHFDDGDESAPEVSSDESDTVTAMLVDQIKTDDGSASLHDGKHPEMPRTESEIVVQPKKRQKKLTACSQPEICSSSVFRSPKADIPSSCSASHDFGNDDLSPRASSQGKVSSTATSQGCHTEFIERAPISDVHVAEHRNKNQQTRGFFDLNVPQIPPDFESGVFMQELGDEKVACSYQKPGNCYVEKIFTDVADSGQQHESLQRRQSTRNRPPTARALEALANGLISVNSRPRKNKATSSRENLTSRSERKAVGGAGITELSSSSMESRIAEGASEVYNSHDSNLISDFQNLSEEKGLPTAGL